TSSSPGRCTWPNGSRAAGESWPMTCSPASMRLLDCGRWHGGCGSAAASQEQTCDRKQARQHQDQARGLWDRGGRIHLKRAECIVVDVLPALVGIVAFEVAVGVRFNPAGQGAGSRVGEQHKVIGA